METSSGREPVPASEPRGATGWRDRLANVVREPLLHFVLLGLLIWAGAEYREAHRRRYTIHIGPAEKQRITRNYFQQFGQPPAPGRIQELLDQYVREEIFVREGLALNLGQDDEMIRRRIAQQYQWLQSDQVAPAAPAPAALTHWFEQNQSRYRTPERVTFTEVYFPPDQEGEEAARTRAMQALETLRRTPAPGARGLGGPFPGLSDPAVLTPDEAARLFGRSELVEQLFNAPLERWSGPFRSGYGWHLIMVTAREPSQVPPWEKIREQVLADYQDEARQRENAAAFQRLKSKYHTVRDDAPGE
ncbi:MAG: peptidylprolyl isomerase [Opitutaceae bacterium]|nr:peptidylprolyl isomerase [Opitutaceae bacterium]